MKLVLIAASIGIETGQFTQTGKMILVRYRRETKGRKWKMRK